MPAAWQESPPAAWEHDHWCEVFTLTCMTCPRPDLPCLCWLRAHTAGRLVVHGGWSRYVQTVTTSQHQQVQISKLNTRVKNECMLQQRKTHSATVNSTLKAVHKP